MTPDMTLKSRKNIFQVRLLDMLAIGVLLIFLLISLPLIRHESATSDEQAHIPAAYSYVMSGNYTLNPEHPPLAKLIGGLGFIGSHYSFPNQLLYGNKKVADRQWEAGTVFLYHSGNNPDSILMRSRLPLLIASIIGLFICYLLFAAVSSKQVALIALMLTTLSPTVIAHGHLVTTDVLVMTTVTIALLCFVRYLQKPSWLYGVIAGVTLAAAQLSKFSAALLFIFYPVAAVLFYYANKPKAKLRGALSATIKALLPTYLVALLIIYGVYALQVLHLDRAAQEAWIIGAAGDPNTHMGARLLLHMNKLLGAAPTVRYIVGFTSSLVRVEVGHGAYLLGQNYTTGTFLYFPVTSLLKTPTPLLALWVLMSGYLGYHLQVYLKKGKGILNLFWHLIRTYPTATFGALFSLLYFLIACTGSLDIGVRHMLPLFPWVAFFTALWMVSVLHALIYNAVPLGRLVSGSLLACFMVIALIVYPHYIPYTTELAGGAPQAYRYYNDSNVDWGQSIKYFASYVHSHPSKLPLYTDLNYPDAKNYYVCGNASICPTLYILGRTQHPPRGVYFAVSETELTINWQQTLTYLKNTKPIAKIGDAIYVYYVP